MQWGDILKKAVTEGLKAALRTTSRSDRGAARRRAGLGQVEPTRGPAQSRRPPNRAGEQGNVGLSGYPGDFTGVAELAYRPQANGEADPGEVVWAWVPFEEDHTQGKDRPALVIGEDGYWLLALMLTSKDHDGDAARHRRNGREWLDIGTGDWDRQRRPSEVRLDRIIRLDPQRVRREGGRLDRKRFDLVAGSVRRVHRW